MLWMVDPVLAQAQTVEMEQAQQSRIQEWRGLAAAGQPDTPDESAEAINELNRGMQTANNLIDFSTRMTNSTIGLIHAMNRH